MFLSESDTSGKMDKIWFREEQRFDQWYHWLPMGIMVLVTAGPLWYGLYSQLTTGEPWGTDPSSDGELIIITLSVTLLMGAIVLLFGALRMQVEVTAGGVRFRYLPLVRKWRMIPAASIERFEVGRYRPVTGFGGWGVRFGMAHIRRGVFTKRNAFHVSGTTGLKLYLRDGRVLLLGTRRSQAITYAMEKMISPQREPATGKF